jgi:hypothetical protein
VEMAKGSPVRELMTVVQSGSVHTTQTCEPGSHFELHAIPWSHALCTCPASTSRGLCKQSETSRLRIETPA